MSRIDDGNPIVLKEIKRRIREEGLITFEEFMDVVLYWPEGGYYTAEREVWGKDGDYMTTIDISPVFGRVLTKQLYEMWSLLNRPEAFCLVEVGAGRGSLSSEISRTAKELYPDFNRALHLMVVERNPFLRGEDSHRFENFETIEEIPNNMIGCIISNELLDSFPVHIMIQKDSLQELYVSLDGDDFIEVLNEPSTPRIIEYLNRLGVTLQEGQRIEINLRALDWIQKAGELIKSGFVMTIDYGYAAREYFLPRKNGNLICYYKHSVNEEPFRRVGFQDITSHVDFSGLALWGSDVDLEVTGFTTQFYFLLGVGVLEELEEVKEFDSKGVDSLIRNQGIKRLIMPGGMGDAFKVLIHHKGLDVNGLSGFNFKDFKEVL